MKDTSTAWKNGEIKIGDKVVSEISTDLCRNFPPALLKS